MDSGERERILQRVARLRGELEQIAALHPEADRENLWHALLLLEEEPIDRLRRALIRGRGRNLHRA